MANTKTSTSQLRLLLLSPSVTSSEPSPFPQVLTTLTGSAPAPDLTTFTGYTTHPPLELRTKYYSSDVSLWCDTLPPVDKPAGKREVSKKTASEPVSDYEEATDASTLAQWKEQMLSTAAAEVRAVIGGIVLILPMTTQQMSAKAIPDNYMRYVGALHAFREAVEDEATGRDIASIIILQPALIGNGKEIESVAAQALSDAATDLENRTIENDMFGWDVVSWTGEPPTNPDRRDATGLRNDYGEKLGMARVREVLEGIDWSVSPHLDDPDADDSGSEGGLDFLGNSRYGGLDHELQQEMLGLKLSMLDREADAEAGLGADQDGEDVSLQQMDDLRSRVLAIRDTVAGMPDAQKEAFARREIDRIMREL
jgi:hypothetical protein